MKRDHIVQWAGGLEFIGTSGTGHSVVIDGEMVTGRFAPVDAGQEIYLMQRLRGG